MSCANILISNVTGDWCPSFVPNAITYRAVLPVGDWCPSAVSNAVTYRAVSPVVERCPTWPFNAVTYFGDWRLTCPFSAAVYCGDWRPEFVMRMFASVHRDWCPKVLVQGDWCPNIVVDMDLPTYIALTEIMLIMSLSVFMCITGSLYKKMQRILSRTGRWCANMHAWLLSQIDKHNNDNNDKNN